MCIKSTKVLQVAIIYSMHDQNFVMTSVMVLVAAA